MSFEWNFDLQLFADEPEEGTTQTSEADAGQESPQGENPQATAPAATILGGAGVEEAKPDAQQEQPGVPEAYDFKKAVPEGMEYNEDQAAAFSALAKECNLTQEQASKLAAYGMKYAMDGVQAAAEAHAAMVTNWAETARTELAGDYDKTVAMAARGIRVVEAKVPGIRQMLDETGAGNRVEMIRMLAELGSLVEESPDIMGNGSNAGSAPIYANTDFNKYN